MSFIANVFLLALKHYTTKESDQQLNIRSVSWTDFDQSLLFNKYWNKTVASGIKTRFKSK